MGVRRTGLLFARVNHVHVVESEVPVWLRSGMAMKARYMIVIVDAFDHDDFPVFVFPDEDFVKKLAATNAVTKRRVTAVYDLSREVGKQLLD
jgi:hypothetical protein